MKKIIDFINWYGLPLFIFNIIIMVVTAVVENPVLLMFIMFTTVIAYTDNKKQKQLEEEFKNYVKISNYEYHYKGAAY